MTEKKTMRVNVRVPEELYTSYKIALLRRNPRRNVTQDLLAYMRSVVEKSEKQNGTK